VKSTDFSSVQLAANFHEQWKRGFPPLAALPVGAARLSQQVAPIFALFHGGNLTQPLVQSKEEAHGPDRSGI